MPTVCVCFFLLINEEKRYSTVFKWLLYWPLMRDKYKKVGDIDARPVCGCIHFCFLSLARQPAVEAYLVRRSIKVQTRKHTLLLVTNNTGAIFSSYFLLEQKYNNKKKKTHFEE